MSDLYRCDGCIEVASPPATFTIQRTDGFVIWSEAYEWHACSWECVERIGLNHQKEPTTKSKGLTGDVED